MNEMQIFSYQDKQVRTIQKDGEPWFVLRDVCQVLDLGSPHKVADRLDEDERSQIPVTDNLDRKQETTIISESGLYTVILRSDKPEAKPFRRWVTHEVLPSIRRTGGYSAVLHSPPEVSPGGLAKLITVTRRVMLEAGGSPLDVLNATQSLYSTWCIPVPLPTAGQLPGQLSLFPGVALES